MECIFYSVICSQFQCSAVYVQIVTCCYYSDIHTMAFLSNKTTNATVQEKTAEISGTEKDWSLIFSSFDPWPQVVYTREPVSTPWIFHHLPAWARFSPYVPLGTWPSGVRMLHWAKQTELLLHKKLIMGGQRGLHGFVVLDQDCPTWTDTWLISTHLEKRWY